MTRYELALFGNARHGNLMRSLAPLRVLFVSMLALITGCQMPVNPVSGQVPMSGGPFMLGVDVLSRNQFDLLRGKRVGLITNHTSYTSNGEMTRVAFRRALGANLTTLFAPEHGLDGREKAGKNISNRRDPVTGLMAYSLHGDYRKPQPFMLKNVDVLVFDVQDIGCRSYTYISTMAVSMEAAAENGKAFVVLDRPNPLGGWRVEGPPREATWKSFVGQIAIPYVHGMTIGELAMMMCSNRLISSVPRLNVVKMQGWQRNMLWQNTGLRWRATSPNIPYATSPAYYVATGILGSAAAADVGIGTSNPFGCAGAAGVNAQAMYAFCSRLNAPGVSFAPYQNGSFGGVRLAIDPRCQTDLTALDVLMLGELNRLSGGRMINRMTSSQLSLFNKVCGSDTIYRTLKRGGSVNGIVSSWSNYTNAFRSQRQRSLLYP